MKIDKLRNKAVHISFEAKAQILPFKRSGYKYGLTFKHNTVFYGMNDEIIHSR
jgi:hypothetical protein